MRALGPVAGLLVVIAGCDSGRGARVDASADARVASDG